VPLTERTAAALAIRLEILPELDLGKNGWISDLPSQNPVQP